MPGCLFDTNVWLAVLFPSHPFHPQARKVLGEVTKAKPAVFCRATQQSFLRLATTSALLTAYSAQGMSNRDALVAYDALLALPQVCERDESPGVSALWRTIADTNTASPKLWMDAYLAAFAIRGNLEFVTLDRDFNNFIRHGLELKSIRDQVFPRQNG